MKKLLLLCCLTALTFFGCKKGDTGAPGTNGTNGNANVQSFTFTNQPWVNSYSEIDLSVPAITQTILDKGAIIVYCKDAGFGNPWVGVPNVNFDLYFQLGAVIVVDRTGAPFAVQDVKVIIIPSL